MSLIVVFENNLSSRTCGVRSWSIYKNEPEFLYFNRDSDTKSIVEVVDTEEQAKDLCVLTPEICIIVAMIEQLFKDNDQPDKDAIRMMDKQARYALLECRKVIKEKHLLPIMAQKYIDKFTLMAKSGSSQKNLLLLMYLLKVKNVYGEVELG